MRAQGVMSHQFVSNLFCERRVETASDVDSHQLRVLTLVVCFEFHAFKCEIGACGVRLGVDRNVLPGSHRHGTGNQTGTLDYRRARNTKLRLSKAASLPVLSIPGGNQTDSELADNRGGDTNAEVSPQGALPVISVPGGTETDPQLAGKS